MPTMVLGLLGLIYLQNWVMFRANVGRYSTTMDGVLPKTHSFEANPNLDLVGGLEHLLFFRILGIVIPIDFHILQRAGSTTNQRWCSLFHLTKSNKDPVDVWSQVFFFTRTLESHNYGPISQGKLCWNNSYQGHISENKASIMGRLLLPEHILIQCLLEDTRYTVDTCFRTLFSSLSLSTSTYIYIDTYIMN